MHLKMQLKKALEPEEKGQLANHMIKKHGVSCRQACKLFSLPRTTFNHIAVVKNETPIIDELHPFVDKHPA